jgi:eukaryotic-like serine/threonine-protein kinase
MKPHNSILKSGYKFFALIMLTLGSCKKNDLPASNTNPVTVSAPSALPAIIVSDTSVVLHWTPVNGAVSYNLYVATDSSFAIPLSGYNPKSVVDTSSLVTTLTAGTNYYYRVEAVSGTGIKSKSSNIISIITLSDSADEYVVVGSDDGNLYCYNASIGSEIWSFQINSAFESIPTVYNGMVYLGGDDSTFYAIDLATGIEKWQVPNVGIIATCAMVNNGVVYFGSYNGNIYALDASSGNQIWFDSFNYPGFKHNIIVAGPTVSNGTLYIGTLLDDSLHAVDASTGTEKWAINAGFLVESNAAVNNGAVYFGSTNNQLFAVNAITGAVEWTYNTGNEISSSPTVNNGIVYVGSVDDKLYAIDATTGILKWTYTTGKAIESSPIVSNGVVYVGSDDDKLYAIDATNGSLKWSETTGGMVISSPVVSNGIVYIGSEDHNLYAFDAVTGAKKWSVLNTDGKNYSSACIVTYNGKVVQSGVSGEVQ